MNLKEFICKLFKRRDDAKRNAESADVGQHYVRGGIHRFASARGKAISDCRRVRLLAAALSSQRGRTPDSSAGDKIRRLADAAKEAGLWLDKTQIATLGDLVSKRTGESEVYWNRSESAFYKVKNPDAKRPLKHTSESDWIYEHVIHNILFPECAYEFVGITLELGEIRVVLKQNAVSTEAFPTENQIEALLAQRGLVREDRYFFGDGVVSVTDVGAHGDNVLLGDDGKVYFIDPLIRLGRIAEDVIEWLTGFNPAAMSREVSDPAEQL